MFVGVSHQSLSLISYISGAGKPSSQRLNHAVINLDFVLAVVFGTLSAVAFGAAIFCFRKALKVSGGRDGDLKMFLWAIGTMFGLIVSGMSAAYILIPIFFHGR